MYAWVTFDPDWPLVSSTVERSYKNSRVVDHLHTHTHTLSLSLSLTHTHTHTHWTWTGETFNNTISSNLNAWICSTAWVSSESLKSLVIYMYTFSRCFYPKWLTVHSGYTCFISMCSLGIEPMTFVLLTQCSTTEPQEHNVMNSFIYLTLN